MRRTEPRFNDHQIWSRGHLVATAGVITDDMITAYVQDQTEETTSNDIELIDD